LHDILERRTGTCGGQRLSRLHRQVCGDQFPAEYKNNILIAEHGSQKWALI
jgi:hypothetical protein